MSESSTIRPNERWNAQVGRWETAPVAVAPVAAPAAPLPTLETRTTPSSRHRNSGMRMYAAARNTRNTAGFGSAGAGTSADAELHTSLPMLRSRARQMVRDSSYAKRAKQIVVDNVIGAGVGMQAQVQTNRTDELNERVNGDIETEFAEWAAAENCHTGGRLHFNDLERAAFGQIFEAGEVLIRMHYQPFGRSRVPMALELIEPERLAHDIVPPGVVMAGADVRMGVEVDQYHRPVAYWIRTIHPGDVRVPSTALDRYERVPAADIFHLYIVNRWPQTRGEPWLHTTVRKLDEMNEYSGLEVTAARGSAAYFATITTPDSDPLPITDEEEDDGTQIMNLEPLTVQQLAPGEKLDFHMPNRPNTALDAFMRAMLREISAGSCTSYESLSRDYSQSNYSSSRMGLLEDRDLWRVLQQWWMRSFRLPFHRKWLQQAVLGEAITSIPLAAYGASLRKYEAVLFKPRGWSWIDPTKEVDAYVKAVKGGFKTVSDVISETSNGQDLEDYIAVRKRELKLLKEAGIVVDTTVVPEPVAKPPVATPSASPDAEDEDEDEMPEEGTTRRLFRAV